MRTTVDLPDELFRQVKAKAALEGTNLKQLLRRYVESGLYAPAPGRRPLKRSKLPVIKSRGKRRIRNLTPLRQSEIQKAEDLAKLDRSFGR
jgi:hypothetical protein